MAMSDGGSTRGEPARPLHVIAGKISEIGDGYILLGFAPAPIRMTDELANTFHLGQRVTITAVMVHGELVAQKIELALR
jgi:hypothetical protein